MSNKNNSPLLCYTWKGLQTQQRIREERQARLEKWSAIIFIVLAVGLIGYSEISDYMWEKEYRHMCDTTGC